MKYKLKYQTRGKVETYIAMTTSIIAAMQDYLYNDFELNSILENISEEVQNQAKASTKGLAANPVCEIEGRHLTVRNTNGREILLVWFDWVYVRKFESYNKQNK